MKTREVIRQLNEADPSGELEVCVHNQDIHFIGCEPAYYDGPLQVLARDETKNGYKCLVCSSVAEKPHLFHCKCGSSANQAQTEGYNIIGGKYARNGSKVAIHTLSISDAIFETPENFAVDYSELSPDNAANLKKQHDDLRKWCAELDNKHEFEYFSAWAKGKLAELTPDDDGFDAVIEAFFDRARISPKDPFGTLQDGYSYVTTRERQWGEKYEVRLEGGFPEIREKSPR